MPAPGSMVNAGVVDCVGHPIQAHAASFDVKIGGVIVNVLGLLRRRLSCSFGSAQIGNFISMSVNKSIQFKSYFCNCMNQNILTEKNVIVNLYLICATKLHYTSFNAKTKVPIPFNFIAAGVNDYICLV